MNKKLTFLFCTCIIFLIPAAFLARAYGQTPPAYVPTITPQAPNAAALMKFTDIPVSPYTGASSVSVPIYNIKSKNISIPISIDYHTGGIKLEEEASNVGLGFVLSASGMISRTINDQDDLGGGYFGTEVPQKTGNLIGYQPANEIQTDPNIVSLDTIASYNCPTCSAWYNCPSCFINSNRYIFYFGCSYKVNFTGGTGDFNNAFSPLGTNPYDMEPDSYSFNFLGHSGRFIILRDEVHVVLEKQDNIKIKVVQKPGGTAADIKFLITDENGTKFYFNKTQSSFPAWKPGGTPTSWLLTKIVTQQNDSVTFNYNVAETTQVAAENTQTYVLSGSYVGWQYGSNIGTTFNNLNLTSIDYADGQVQFFYDHSREDLPGANKLDSIEIFSKTTAGLKYLKSDRLYYTYFNPGSGINAPELERLKLDSVKEFSGASALRPYSFVYNNPATASGFGQKHSFAIDHWGYYNGAGNTELIPTTSAFYLNDVDVGPTEYTFPGANREPSFPNTQAFSLQQVYYPTGGYSVFTYEHNTYDYDNSISKQVEYPQQVLLNVDTTFNYTPSPTLSGTYDFSKIAPVIPSGVAGNNLRVTVAFVKNVDTPWTSAEHSTFRKLYFNFNGTYTDINDGGLTCTTDFSEPGVCSSSYTYTISPTATGLFPWTAYYDSTGFSHPLHFDLIHVRLQYQVLQTVAQGTPTLAAGGLRIHSIKDYSGDGAIAKTRTWNYHYGSTNQYSYGKLMSFPSYIRQEEQHAAGGGHLPALILFSSSVTNPTSAISGNIVGYSSVTETTVDVSNNDNGKTVYTYYNMPDSVISYGGLRMPGIPNMGNNLNGMELSRITYRKNGTEYWKVAETDNTYRAVNDTAYYSAKYLSNPGDNPAGDCGGVEVIPNAGIAEFFRSINSQRVLHDTTKNFVYDPADTTNFQKTVTVSYYDNPIHYLQTRSKTTDSGGDIHVSKTTYPQDYIPAHATKTSNNILDSLIAHNMVTETIETRDSLYRNGASPGYVASATENRYKQLATGSLPHSMELDTIYRLDVVKPVNDFTPMSISGNTYSHDSRYRALIAFDKYDNYRNITQYTQYRQLPTAILWDYRHQSPIAQAKNAALIDIAYTSFEADSSGNWNYTYSATDSTDAAITGTKSYNLSGHSLSKASLTSTTTYIVSYWTTSSSNLSIAGTITGYPIKGPTINGYTYYEHQVTGQTTISITGTGRIDEVRLYPLNAEMTSYTYNPQIGVSSINDARAGIHYYEYDNFHRLMNIKDQNGNIIKSYEYHYANQ